MAQISIPRYTVDDLHTFPSDGNRYEILDGVLLVTPAPASRHQVVAGRLTGILYAAIAVPAYGHVYPVGVVQIIPHTHLEPDLLVVSSRSAPDAKWDDMPDKWLAVEIYSPGSRRYDRDFKRDAYHAMGVQNVWLVDIDNRCVEMSTGPGASRTERNAIEWAVPGASSTIRIDLAGELLQGLA